MPVKRVSGVGWTLVAALLVVAVAVSPVVVAADGVEVRAVDHGGPGVVPTENGRPYVASWQPSTVSVTVAGDGNGTEVCLQTDRDDGSTMLLGCEPLGSAGANPTDERRVGFEFATWPANATGDRTVTAVVRPGDGGEPVAQASRGVTVLAPAGDADGDNLGNRDELDRGTDVLVTDTDTDTDGVPDGEEVNRYETDPTSTDTDGDDLSDGVEINEQGSNSTETDTDGDGRGDGAEVEAGTDPNAAPGAVVGSLELGGEGWLLVLAVAAIAVALLVVGVRVRDSDARARLSDVRARAADHVDGRGDGASADAVQTGGGDSAARAQSAANSSPADGSPAAEELLDDETRVLRLLDDNGGQLRQSKVVEGTEWSKSKVSRVLSRMADEGTVAKINLGRENLIARPESVPEHARSPFDES